MEVQKNASEPITQRTWFKFGLYGGAAAIAITVILYVIDELLLFDIYGFLPLFIVLGLSIYAAVHQRNIQNGEIAYSTAVVTSLGAWILGLLINLIFGFLLFYLIDSNLTERAIELAINKIENAYSTGEINDEARKAGIDQFNIRGGKLLAFQSIIMTILMAIIGLIVFLISSAIIRKEGGPAHHTI